MIPRPLRWPFALLVVATLAYTIALLAETGGWVRLGAFTAIVVGVVLVCGRLPRDS